MAKPKTPNQKKLYRKLNTRIIEYTAAIERIYNTLNLEAAKAYERTDYNTDSDKPFRWADYPQTKKQIEDLQSRYANEIRTLILTNTSKEWENSNEAQDLLADKVLRAFGVEDITEDRYKRYYQANKDALKNFQERKTKGLNLSQRVWNLSDSYKDELEMAISVGVESGMSANSLATQIKKYLNDPDRLFRRVRDKFGNLVLSKNAKLFHPGQGVYRSSYRNAQRLAISEINMAYRQAENMRWQQMDFVVGYEIKLSTNHNCKGIPLGHFYDICDDLKGKYPKDFVWSGWHPMCRCYKVPILKTEEEFWSWDGRGEAPTDSVNKVEDMPDVFQKWAKDNAHRIEKSRERGTLPYFLKNNNFITEYYKYNKDEWDYTYYNSRSNGFVVTDKKRISYSMKNKQEKAKYDKETAMCKVFADNGYRIEHLSEAPGVSSPDVTINGKRADLKRTASVGNIVKYAKKATKAQNAECVLFQFDIENKDLHTKLELLKKEGIKCRYFFTGRETQIFEI